jgi:hypothetical protein
MLSVVVKESEMVEAINTLSAVFARCIQQQKLYSIKENKLKKENNKRKRERTPKTTYICNGCKNKIFIPGMIVNTTFDIKYYCNVLCKKYHS